MYSILKGYFNVVFMARVFEYAVQCNGLFYAYFIDLQWRYMQ